MKRRDFLTKTTLAAAGATTLLTAACNTNVSSEKKEEKSKDENLSDDFELNEITVVALQEKMKSGAYTSEKITQLYLDRIKKIDKAGPAINSVIEINPDALTIAKQMDDERKSGKVRGPLHGIPVLLKANIDT